MACGRVLCLTDSTEMGTYFHAMPANERVTLCESADEYLEEMTRA
jgi:hypothetical protein